MALKAKTKIIAFLCLILFVPAALWFFTPYKRRSYTCLQCRLGKTVESWWDWKRVTFSTNECSEWYAVSHPGHEHEWIWSGSGYGRTGFTFYLESGKFHAVFMVQPELQKAILLSSTPEEAAEWFRLLESERSEDHEKALQLALEAYK